MSKIYSAGQYEQDYLPHRLGNWMAPDTSKMQATSATGRYGTLKAKPKGARTGFIVDDKGHLLPGVPKINSAFSTTAMEQFGAAPRWPRPLPTVSGAPAATMGYKGIQTDYLPTGTVTIKTVEVPGCRERKYM